MTRSSTYFGAWHNLVVFLPEMVSQFCRTVVGAVAWLAPFAKGVKMSLPSREDLAKLPARAIVAYAVRCARRVEPRYAAAMSDRPDLIAAVGSAIQQAERFASGDATVLDDAIADAADRAARAAHTAAVADAADAAARAAHAAARAAHAAVDAAHVTARAAHAAAFAASFAAFAAADAADAAAFVHAANHDFQRLTELARSGEDLAISPSEDGPLGPLWANGSSPARSAPHAAEHGSE